MSDAFVTLNDGKRIPQLGFGVCGSPTRRPGGRRVRLRGRLPPDRHRRDVRQRGGDRPRRRRLRPAPRGGLRRHQGLERPPRLRRDPAGLRGVALPPRPRPCRPLPRPLAGAAARGVCRHLARPDAPARGRPRPLDRRVQLHGRAPEARHRRHRLDALGQPDRAASALPAGRPAPVPRGGRDRHRGLGAPRRGGLLDDPRSGPSPTSTAAPRRRSCCAGTSTSAPSRSRNRPIPPVSARTARSQASASTPRTAPASRPSTIRRGGWGRIRRRSGADTPAPSNGSVRRRRASPHGFPVLARAHPRAGAWAPARGYAARLDRRRRAGLRFRPPIPPGDRP